MLELALEALSITESKSEAQMLRIQLENFKLKMPYDKQLFKTGKNNKIIYNSKRKQIFRQVTRSAKNGQNKWQLFAPFASEKFDRLFKTERYPVNSTELLEYLINKLTSLFVI